MANWKKILVAVDEAKTSMRALRYVCELAGEAAGVHVTLLHIYPEPPPDFFRSGHSLQEYMSEKEMVAQKVFDQAMEVISQFGIDEDDISTICRMTAGTTISQSLLQVQNEGEFGTVVVGKRGISRAEEFLFGSISNTIVRKSQNFTVWVVA